MALNSGDILVYDGNNWVNTGYSQVNCVGNLGIGVGTNILALLHLKAGTASANTAPLKFTKGTNLTTPEQGAVEFDGFRLLFTPVSTRRAAALTSDHITVTAGAVNTTSVVTVFTGTVAANEMAAGKTFVAHLIGRYSTANAVDTFTVTCKIGSTTITELNITSTAKSVTNTPMELRFIFTCRTTGATGTVRADCEATFDHVDVSKPGTGDTTIDTTAAQNVSITMQWTAANANNSTNIGQAYLAVLN
jgi:hypothetical protein